MSIQVAIYVFPEVEVLDFAGPFEVFSTAARLASRGKSAAPPEPLFVVSTVSQHSGPVRARGGLEILPSAHFASHPPVDLLIVPGGVVSDELEKPDVIDWIRHVSGQATLTASVCTGVFMLATAGLLGSRQVTTHWEDIEELRRGFPALQVVGGCRWVDGDRYVTSAGISAGIDMSLHLVERLAGRELAEVTARQMEFDWQTTP